MSNIYAVITEYESNTRYNSCIYAPKNHDGIYYRMMKITDGDHEISADAASWCELATIGETYDFRGGEIEIMELER